MGSWCLSVYRKQPRLLSIILDCLWFPWYPICQHLSQCKPTHATASLSWLQGIASWEFISSLIEILIRIIFIDFRKFLLCYVFTPPLKVLIPVVSPRIIFILFFFFSNLISLAPVTICSQFPHTFYSIFPYHGNPCVPSRPWSSFNLFWYVDYSLIIIYLMTNIQL